MMFDPDFLDWYLGNPWNPQQLIVMRGMPGSGKSFTANSLAPAEKIFSADDFWGKTIEEYRANWNAEKLYTAHKICENNVRKAMQTRVTPVVVDNTHIRFADVLPYAEMALQYGYKLSIKEPTSPWWIEKVAPYLYDKEKHVLELEEAARILFEKNTHGVPLETIQKMIRKWRGNIRAEDVLLSIFRRRSKNELSTCSGT